ncbi:COG1361 S-layer family protein, partial [Chitinophaga arvensicola]
MACVIGVQAQSATYKNITGVSGKPSITGNTVSDISFTTFQFPAIGLALSASAPDLQNDGSYNITYTYTVKNMGGLDLTKVNVNSSFSSTFPSPMTYTITSVSGQGITTNSTFKGTDALPSLSNTNATLAAGATATITVVVNLKNNGQYGTFTTQPAVTAMAGTSTVSDLAVNGAVPDANGNGSAFDDESPTPVTLARPDIEVKKTANTLTPYVGNNVVFTITVTNKGTGDAANVVIAEALGNGFTYVSTSVGSAYNTTTKNWSVGILKSGQSKTMTLTAKVNMSGTYTNTASSNHPEDIVPANNSDIVTVAPLPSADVQIVKTASKDSVNVRDNVTYTLTAGNNGPSHATEVAVTDTLPAGLVPVLPLAGALTYDPATRVITWNLGNVNAGTTGLVQTFDATVSEDMGRAVFANKATITRKEYDPKASNNSSTAAVVPKQFVDLVVTKSINAPSPLYPLDKVTFTVTVQNTGSNNCYDVTVTDVLQSGYNNGTATASKGTFANNNWKITQLNKGETATLTYQVTVQPKGNYNNSATAYTTDNDINLANNTAAIVPPVVTPRMDLAVGIATSGTPQAGQPLTFTVTATNNGPSDATGVIVENLQLPAGYTLTQSTPGSGTYNSSTGVLTIGNLAAGSSTILTLIANVNPDETDYTLNAHITGNETEVTLTNNTASVTPAIKQATDLAVTKTVDFSTPDAGSNVVFTIVAKNDGPSKATNVKVVDALPAGYTFVSASSAAYTGNTWTVGTLNVNQSATLTITAKVNASGSYQNTATISGAEVDNNTSNNTASVSTTPVPVSDVKITKTLSNNAPDAGSTVTFTITATNDGPSVAQSVTVKDVLENGYTYAVNPTPSVGTFNKATGIWTIGNMAAGKTESIALIVKVLGKGTSYGNTATITTTTKDNNTTNNTATVPPATVRAVTDLQIEKTVDKATADAGTKVVFTLKATNKGASPATNVKVTDLLPSGFTFESVQPSNAAYVASSGEWAIGTLDSGEVKSIQLTAIVNATGNYTNTATITGSEYDPVTTNNTSDVTVTRVAVTDLEVLKTVDNTTPDVGATVTFTIKAINHGPSKATGVVVDDPAPSGYGNITYNPTVGTVDTDGKWTIGDLNKDAVATLTVTAKVLASGSYLNTATISGTETDRTTTNNTSSVTSVPVPVADLVVTKTISNSTPDVGNTVTFTITAKNNGPSTATGVTVTDLLKSGYLFKQKTVSSGAYNETTSVWTIG